MFAARHFACGSTILFFRNRRAGPLLFRGVAAVLMFSWREVQCVQAGTSGLCHASRASFSLLSEVRACRPVAVVGGPFSFQKAACKRTRQPLKRHHTTSFRVAGINVPSHPLNPPNSSFQLRSSRAHGPPSAPKGGGNMSSIAPKTR